MPNCRDRLINPPLVLGKGYVITKFESGWVNEWRPLGIKSRPLKKLVESENNASY